MADLVPGQVIDGDLFVEPMRVENVAPAGPDAWDILLSGSQTMRLRRFRLTVEDLRRLHVYSRNPNIAEG